MVAIIEFAVVSTPIPRIIQAIIVKNKTTIGIPPDRSNNPSASLRPIPASETIPTNNPSNSTSCSNTYSIFAPVSNDSTKALGESLVSLLNILTITDVRMAKTGCCEGV